MRVGLTYDLKTDYLDAGLSEEEMAEFDRPDTIVALEEALRGLGHETDRVGNLNSLVSRLASGQRWDMVFNIAEGLHGFGREGAVPALLESYRIPCTFSDSMVMALTLHKGMTKHVLRSVGLPTPDFALVSRPEDVDAVRLGFPLFVKPVAEGTSKGIDSGSRVHDREQLEERCRLLLERHRQPVMVETFLPGREFTVGLVGRDPCVWATAIEITYRDPDADPIYCFLTKENCEELIDYLPVDDAAAQECIGLARRAWERFGLRDAARVDVRLDGEGRPSILEINPLPGMHPEHSDLPIMWSQAGRPYRQLIEEITESCRSRTS